MRITIAALICVCVVQGASAAELPLPPIVQPAPVLVQQPSRYLQQGLFFELGARYWYSSGKLSKDLFGGPFGGPDLVSRLSYSGLTGHAAVLYTRDRLETFNKLLEPKSLVILATQTRWWPTCQQKLARALTKTGHHVMLLPVVR